MTPRLTRRMLRLTAIDAAHVHRILQPAPHALPYPLDLAQPLLWLGQQPYPQRLAFTHTLCLGRSGSGKTSAILPAFVAAYMRLGWGMLCCTYKADDAALLIDLARQTGREDSLIVVSEHSHWRYNIIEGALAESDGDAKAALNATALLMEGVNNRAEGGQRKETESIWNDATSSKIRHDIALQQAAGLPAVTLQNMKRLGDSLPTRHAMTGELIWPKDGFLYQCLQRAQRNPKANPEIVRDCIEYYTLEMTRSGSSRFVSSILGNFSSVFDPLMAPGSTASELFFSDKPSTFHPGMSRQGAIIILDLPASTGGEAYRTASLLFKAAWINAMLRTQGLEEPSARPVAFVCDEYQRLATHRDTLLYETGRSALIAAFCLTQNIPNLYKAFGTSAGEKAVFSLLSGFGTYIACQNHDPETNDFLARVIAKDHTRRYSGGTSWQDSEQTNHGKNSSSGGGSSAGGGSSSWQSGSQTSTGRSTSSGTNTGWREEMDFRLQPVVFQNLRPGGAPHYAVDAVVYASGYRFADGLPYLGTTFPQHLPTPYVPARKGRRWLRR